MLPNIRQIQRSRRTPRVPPRWNPLTDKTWHGEKPGVGTMMLVPKEWRNAPYLMIQRLRQDNTVVGRHYAYMWTLETDVQPTTYTIDTRTRPWGAEYWNARLKPLAQFMGSGLNLIHGSIATPSVTTILDKVIESADLDAWRDSVGHEKADAIAEASALQGTNVHELVEHYVQAVLDEWMAKYPPTAEEMSIFDMIRQHLDTFDEFIAAEVTVYNFEQGYSGTIDLIGRKNGKTILVDIKTYGRERKDEHLDKARIQVTLYALALIQTYDINIDSAEIVYANLTTGLRVVPVDLATYATEAIEVVDKYYALHS